jgi:hypothetical protein
MMLSTQRSPIETPDFTPETPIWPQEIMSMLLTYFRRIVTRQAAFDAMKVRICDFQRTKGDFQPPWFRTDLNFRAIKLLASIKTIRQNPVAIASNEEKIPCRRPPPSSRSTNVKVLSG